LVSAAPLFAQTGGIQGACKSEKGEPLVGNPILIERQEVKGVYKTKTDKHGKYIYIGLPLGGYKVTLQDANGRTLFSLTKHVGMGDPTDFDFDLAKERAEQQKEQMANPEAQKKLEQESRDSKQFSGLKQLYEQGNALVAEAQQLQAAPDAATKRDQIQAKYAQAAAAFEQAAPMAKDKNLAVVLGRAAESYTKAHQYDKAVDDYQKAIAANLADSELHNGLGNAYAEMGKITEAQAEFQKSADMNPSGASHAYFNLGAVMYNKGKTDEAAAAFKKATEIDPNYADAYFLEAQALMGKATLAPDGKVVPAPGTMEALETYLKLEPSGKHVVEAQAMLQTIQGSVQTEIKVTKKKKKA
jgi:tetratricopeptide (TPR) repeat protein